MKRNTNPVDSEDFIVERSRSHLLAGLVATVAVLAVSLCQGVQASIATGGAVGLAGQTSFSGNGELFLSVYDSVGKVSYTLDLGIDQTFVYNSGQQDYGIQQFWPVTDANWTSFLDMVTPANLPTLRWSVLGLDSIGPTTGVNARGGIKLYTTIKQGDESKVGLFTNQLFTVATGNPFASFFSAVNSSGTHPVPGTNATDYYRNGSSVNADPSNGYFGKTGMAGPKLGAANTPFENGNLVGQSSWFYYLTRSSGVQLDTVFIDEFDNLGHDAYWGFIRVPDNADSIYKGKYLLSYTLESVAPTATTAAGQLRMSFTDYSAGFASKLLVETQLGEFAGYRPSSLVVPSPVPEPATWGLLGLGLLVIGFKTRQKQPRA